MAIKRPIEKQSQEKERKSHIDKIRNRYRERERERDRFSTFLSQLTVPMEPPPQKKKI